MKNNLLASTPPAVTIPVLREHFRTAYKLNEAQVELMIRSSKKSLDVSLSAAKVALTSEDSCDELTATAHNLKGLLMNMGQNDWALFAREIEKAAKSNEKIDYAGLIERLCVGLAAVTGYSPE